MFFVNKIEKKSTARRSKFSSCVASCTISHATTIQSRNNCRISMPAHKICNKLPLANDMKIPKQKNEHITECLLYGCVELHNLQLHACAAGAILYSQNVHFILYSKLKKIHGMEIIRRAIFSCQRTAGGAL